MGNVPKHIGIILDGNRRFSKKLMMKPWKGHEWGAKKVEMLLDWSYELGIDELTLYAFSYENFNRPKKEFDYLMDIFRDEFDRLIDDRRLVDHNVRINVIGRTWLFPKDIQDKITRVMEQTRDHKKNIVNIALGYGGRAEVIDAVKKISEKVLSGKLDIDQINEETFSRCLYMEDEPDLIIRTGGAHRTSNFLVWQSAYSEWIFLEKTWPEFEKEDLIQAIEEYGRRERRFGK